jgi:hypothetical protein
LVLRRLGAAVGVAGFLFGILSKRFHAIPGFLLIFAELGLS